MNMFKNIDSIGPQASSPDSRMPRAAKKAKAQRGFHKAPSAQEIRDKVRAHFNKDKAAHQVTLSKKVKNITDNENVKIKKLEEVQNSELIGDIKDNNPTSGETLEKLKKVLQNGTFEFGDKVKTALQRILNGKV